LRSQEHHNREEDLERGREPAQALEQDVQSELLDEEEQSARSAHYFEVVGLVERMFRAATRTRCYSTAGSPTTSARRWC
jgi:hypothetical protein